jgi:hypothetical protein
MGNSCSTRLEWSSTASSADSTIITSVQNEAVISDLARYIQVLCDKYKDDAQTEFKHHLQYVTSLRPLNFEGSSEFIVHNVGSKTSISSTALNEHGIPLLEINQVEKDKFVAKVYSFDYLQLALHLSGNQKLKELQVAIQSNKTFLNTITGIEGDQNSLYLQAFDALQTPSQSAGTEKRNSKARLLRLLLILNTFDLELLKDTVKSLSSNVFVNMTKVTDELKLLQNFSGYLPNHALKSIDWENELVFSNGYRSAPWRQINGEIAYILVKPADKDQICVTASQNGYFINKGYFTNDKGVQSLNYEKNSDVYPSLMHLLRNYSPHFSKVIDNQELFTKEKEEKKEKKAGQPRKAVEKDDDGKQAKNKVDADRKTIATGASKKKQTTKAKSNNDQPSSRWKNIDITQHPVGSVPSLSHSSESTNRKKSRQALNVDKFDDDLSDAESATSEEEIQEKRQEGSELPAEYWQIQKLVKYLKIGNQTATIIAICALKDFDLKNEINQLAIREVEGLQVLVNLLDTEDPKCKIGSLQILKEITQNVQIRRLLADMDVIKPLVDLIKDSNDDLLRCLAAETIAHCAKHSANRNLVRKYGGIKKLVRLLRSKNEAVACSGALALCSCSKSQKNKEAIRAAGAIPLLAELLKSQNVQLLIPVVGILQECASDGRFIFRL